MCSPLMASADRVLGLLYVDNLDRHKHLHGRGPAVPGGVQRPRRDRHQEFPLRRPDPARGHRALQLRALLRAQRRGRHRPAGRGHQPGRRAAAHHRPVQRHPRLHGHRRVDGTRRHRPAPHRVLHRDGGGDLRARRHARQVHRRRHHGALGVAHRPRRRSRPRGARGDRHAARDRPAQRALGEPGPAGDRRRASGSTTARCSPGTSAAIGGSSTP